MLTAVFQRLKTGHGGWILFLLALSLIGLVFILTSCTGGQGPAGPQGPAGAPAPLAPGADRALNLTIAVSKPANGTYLAADEKATVTLTLKDANGAVFTKDDFATLNLYMDGPQDPTKTKTAVKLLNATTDRSKTPHHYIDLLTDANAKAQGNIVTYGLQAVSNEEAGTYIVSAYAVLKQNALDQQFPLVEVQVGTATPEKQLVDGSKCGACHKGADSGKYYMHHVDPGRTPAGNWALDSDPVRTCKSCHNNDG
jgi:hypothetical protein